MDVGWLASCSHVTEAGSRSTGEEIITENANSVKIFKETSIGTGFLEPGGGGVRL